MRVAIVGFGLAGRVFHAPLIHATAGLEVAVVVTNNPTRAAQAREAYPYALVVQSVEEAWGEADLAVIATPNRFHADLALQAIERGLPVVIDKPFAVTSEQAAAVLDAGGRVTVFQNRRWDGDFLTAARFVREGALGDVLRWDSHFERFRPQPKGGWREEDAAQEGGGQLLDLGSHLVDQAIVLFGRPVRVYAEVDVRRPGITTDDDVFVALEHPGGVRSHLRMGAISAPYPPRLQVTGLGGVLAIDGLDPQEPQLASGVVPGDAGYGVRPAPGRLLGPDGNETAVDVEAGRYQDFYAGVRAWLADGAPPPVDPAESLLVLQVIEAARESAATGQVVTL